MCPQHQPASASERHAEFTANRPAKPTASFRYGSLPAEHKRLCRTAALPTFVDADPSDWILTIFDDRKSLPSQINQQFPYLGNPVLFLDSIPACHVENRVPNHRKYDGNGFVNAILTDILMHLRSAAWPALCISDPKNRSRNLPRLFGP